MDRRTALVLALGAAAGLAGCTTDDVQPPGRPMRVAAGEDGGFYVEFARLLAARLEPAGTVLETGGSMRNISLIRAGKATLGLCLADVAEAAVIGRTPFSAPVPLRAIGRVYENYAQLVVTADSDIRTVADLAGRRVSLGAEGSGAAIFGGRLLSVTGVSAQVEHNPLTVATKHLAAGRIDALLWSGGVPTPALARLDRGHRVRFVRLTEHLPALHAAYGTAYHRVVIPARTYSNPRPVPTVGVPNLLLADPDLPDDAASAVARTLVEDAPRLVPSSALGTQYLELRSLIATGAVPLHPGAVSAYRSLRG